MMKKCFSVLLLFSLVLALLTACGGEKKPSDGQSDLLGQEEATFYDCYGTAFNLYQENLIDTMPFSYFAGSNFADMALNRVKEVETNLNCTIKYCYNADVEAYVISSSASGSSDADIVYAGTSHEMNLALKQMLHDFSDSPIIDTSDLDRYGPLNLQESIMVDGVTYGLIPMKWINKSYEGNIGSFLCFNEDIIKDNNMPNPRELHEQKRWWATEFTDLLPQYAIIDDSSSVYAMSAHKSNFVRAILGANGMKMAAEQNGEIVEAFDTPEVLNMLTWADDFMKKNKDYIKFLSDYTSFEEFIAKTCTLAVIETMWIDDISLKVYNFGILPFPCGPDIEYDTQTTYYSTIDSFVLPELTQDPESGEYVLYAMTEPFEGFEDRDSILAYLDDSLFFNHEDTIYYDSLYKNTQYQYYCVKGYQFMEDIASYLGTTRTPAEIISSLRGTNKENVDKYIAPNYNYIKEHSGE